MATDVKQEKRTSTRRTKEKWKTKEWYTIYAPDLFDRKTVGETLTTDPDKLRGRIVEATMHELNGDLSRAHIKLKFQVEDIKGNGAYTKFIGHGLTSDYLRRLARRKQSRIDCVVDFSTKDGIDVRIKAMAITGRKVKSTQGSVIRNTITAIVKKSGSNQNLNGFVRALLSGELSAAVMKQCKMVYPIQRIELKKSELSPYKLSQIVMPEPKPEAQAATAAGAEGAEKAQETGAPSAPATPAPEEVASETPAPEEVPKEK